MRQTKRWHKAKYQMNGYIQMGALSLRVAVNKPEYSLQFFSKSIIYASGKRQ